MNSRHWTAGGAVGAFVLGLIVGTTACSDTSEDAESDESQLRSDSSTLMQTLNELAAFGEKRVGTPGGQQAAQYLMTRMQAAGLQNVHFEEFNFPMHNADVARSSFQLTNNGQPMPPIAFDVFEGSGNGRADNAPVVFVGSAKPEDLQGKDLRGKIAFVDRDNKFHRSSQYRNVAAAGAVAMLYMSEVPGNQIQIGSVREKWESMGPIPTITIGQDDGNSLRCLLGAGGEANNGQRCDRGGEIRSTIEVNASSSHGTGKNVIGVVPGKNFGKRDAQGRSLDQQIVVGAHFDTWYVGSVDNGCGVAGLLSLAEKRAHPATVPEYTTVFVGFDGEEVALYGGYDYLRRHQNDGLLTVINLEQPSAETDVQNAGLESIIAGVATSEIGVIENVLRESEATGPFTAFAVEVSLDRIARMFGGIIPTDIQGMYRSGVPTISTASFSAWYHTRNDTPDKVDTTALARVVRTFGRTIDRLQTKPAEQFKALDSKLWDADVEVISRGAQDNQALVAVTLKDSKGELLPQQNVTGTFFCDDFFASREVASRTDGQGKAVIAFKDELVNCKGRRWVHVTAGPEFPLVEKVRSVPGPESSGEANPAPGAGSPPAAGGSANAGEACSMRATDARIVCKSGLTCRQPDPDSMGTCGS
jgi:hypothetical protein